jgi:hypothetical protein
LAGGTALLSLWARQRLLPSENAGHDDSALVRSRRRPERR